MLAKVLDLRVNFAVVFIGSLVIILLIKSMAFLLPGKFYFNFSNVVSRSGDTGALIVDPPSVTASKLCEIMDRNKIARDTFDRSVQCDEDSRAPVVLSGAQTDKIYGIALQSDRAVRDAISQVVAGATLKPLTEAEIKKIASEKPTFDQAFEAIFEHYANQIREIVQNGPSKAIEALYADVIPADDAPADSDPDNPKGGLPDDVRQKIMQAMQSLPREVTGAALVKTFPAIQKSSVDTIIAKVGKGESSDIGAEITEYYTASILDELRASMAGVFSRQGLKPGTENAQSIIFSEINKFSWKNYVLAILLRLTPVFLFGLVVGAALGRGELFSIALAAGLTAFLLSWPLMLMWDRLVQSSWSDKKLLFFGLYAVYMVSFFVTARSAALLGIWLREQKFAAMAVETVQGMAPGAGLGVRVTLREVMVNVAGAVVLNGLVYAWNLFIPLGASS